MNFKYVSSSFLFSYCFAVLENIMDVLGSLSVCVLAMSYVLVVQAAPVEEATCDKTIISALYTYCKTAAEENVQVYVYILTSSVHFCFA